jgi:5-methylcytosine-specific restriction protein A
VPSVPKPNQCSHLGCHEPRFRHYAYCEVHGGTAVRMSKKRVEQMGMYNNRTWERHRTTQLYKQPLCQACLTSGIVRSATTIDHVFPWSGIGKEYFYHNIFQSLCTECHSVKTALEQKGIIRHYVDPVKDYTIDDAKVVINNML